jgi:hypothetical protein
LAPECRAIPVASERGWLPGKDSNLD